jgi:hydrogenase maturation protease
MVPEKQIRVLGVGNVLMGDDALGPYVVRTLLAGYEFPGEVEVLDVGTPGLDFTPYLAGARAVIVVDTVRSEGPPGTIREYRDHEILGGPPLPRSSPHQPGLREALMAAELTDSNPGEIVLIGVIPESVESGTGLSESVRTAVDTAVESVLRELERLGAGAKERNEPDLADIWWEMPTDGT